MSIDREDPLDLPDWIARGRPTSPEADEARALVEEAIKQIERTQRGEEALYLGSKFDEALALQLLAALRDWTNGQTWGDRVHFVAHVVARVRKRRGNAWP